MKCAGLGLPIDNSTLFVNIVNRLVITGCKKNLQKLILKKQVLVVVAVPVVA